LIIGDGLIARGFASRYTHDDSIVIFASGVSNSTETGDAAFRRERSMLMDALGLGRRLVYFSSCSIASNSESLRPYMRHKAEMEKAVLAADQGLVLRLPQVVGYTNNPNTLTNFLRDRILRREPFDVWAKAERNLVDIDDVVAIGTEILQSWPSEDRVLAIAASVSTPMPEIVAAMEEAMGIHAIQRIIEAGESMPIDCKLTSAIARRLRLDLENDYVRRIIGKYYGHSTS
jgi:nucleoside-diphosphate-sugar epimerase